MIKNVLSGRLGGRNNSVLAAWCQGTFGRFALIGRLANDHRVLLTFPSTFPTTTLCRGCTVQGPFTRSIRQRCWNIQKVICARPAPWVPCARHSGEWFLGRTSSSSWSRFLHLRNVPLFLHDGCRPFRCSGRLRRS